MTVITVTNISTLLYGVKNIMTCEIVDTHVNDGQHVRIGEMYISK